MLVAIGEGGMGQVWRARDTKLNRDVALKVLPDSCAHDPERLARFTREAQTLALLNHPHIAAIYGLEESGGVRALVMELVEGDDLSQRIAKGAIPLRAAPANYVALRISPDGTGLALGVSGQQDREVWTYDPQRDVRTRLTASEDYISLIWSPDGRHVVFARATGGVFLARADGARQPQALVPSKSVLYPWSFAPDGKRMAYSEIVSSGVQQIWTVPVEDRAGELSAGTPEAFLASEFSDTAAAFSPDGRWLAYQSNESGTEEVYVRPCPPPASGQGSRWQVSNNGGTVPRWSRTGRELMYWAGDSIMVVSYTVSGDAFVADKPRVWIAALGGPGGWDLAPDGKRVLVVTPVEGAGATKADHHVVFLQNFFDELRRKVPLGK